MGVTTPSSGATPPDGGFLQQIQRPATTTKRRQAAVNATTKYTTNASVSSYFLAVKSSSNASRSGFGLATSLLLFSVIGLGDVSNSTWILKAGSSSLAPVNDRKSYGFSIASSLNFFFPTTCTASLVVRRSFPLPITALTSLRASNVTNQS